MDDALNYDSHCVSSTSPYSSPSHSAHAMLPRHTRLTHPAEQRTPSSSSQPRFRSAYPTPLPTGSARPYPYPPYPPPRHTPHSSTRSQEESHAGHRLARSGSLNGPISLLADVALADATSPTSFTPEPVHLPPLQRSVSRSHDSMSQASQTSSASRSTTKSQASQSSKNPTSSSKKKETRYKFGEIPPSPVQPHGPIPILNYAVSSPSHPEPAPNAPRSRTGTPMQTPVVTESTSTPTPTPERQKHPLQGLSLDKSYGPGEYKEFMADASRILLPPFASGPRPAPITTAKLVGSHTYPPGDTPATAPSAPLVTRPLPRRNTLDGNVRGIRDDPHRPAFSGPAPAPESAGSLPKRPWTAGRTRSAHPISSPNGPIKFDRLRLETQGAGRETASSEVGGEHADPRAMQNILPTPTTSLPHSPASTGQERKRAMAMASVRPHTPSEQDRRPAHGPDYSDDADGDVDMSGSSSSRSPSLYAQDRDSDRDAEHHGGSGLSRPRPHSASISSSLSIKTEPAQTTAALPLSPPTPSVSAGGARPRASNRLKMRAESSAPTTPPGDKAKPGPKHPVRRGGERRKEQNAVAQKRYRAKKKDHREQMARELERQDSQRRLLQADLEARNRELEQRDRELVERERQLNERAAEIGSLKRKLEALSGQ